MLKRTDAHTHTHTRLGVMGDLNFITIAVCVTSQDFEED